MRTQPPAPARPAPFWDEENTPSYMRRLIGILLDVTIFLVLFAIWATIVISSSLGESGAADDPGGTANGALALLVLPIFLALPVWWYFTAVGATPGKRLLGLRVVKRDGSAPGAGVGLLRTFIGMFCISFSSIGGFVSWLWPLWDGQSQTWHDKLADTNVIRIAPPEFEGF